MEYTTKNGTVLEIGAVNSLTLQDYAARLGVYDIAGKQGDATKLREVITQATDKSNVARTSQTIMQLFNYVMGWGVKTDPAEEAIAQLDELGFGGKSPQMRRINWLRYLVLEDESEAAIILNLVMRETMKVSPKENIEDDGDVVDDDEDED